MSTAKNALDRLTDMSGELFTALNRRIGDAAVVQAVLTEVQPVLLRLATDEANRAVQVENEGVRGAVNRLMEYERLRVLRDAAQSTVAEYVREMDDLASAYPDLKRLCDALAQLGVDIGTTVPKKEKT